MIFDHKIAIITIILILNLIFTFSQKGRIAACFNVATTIFLLIVFLSVVTTNQMSFKNISFALLIYLITCVFMIVRQKEVIKNKKEVKRNSFSFGYFLLVSLAVIGTLLSVSFLTMTDFKSSQKDRKIDIIEKIDVNNSRLAKKKQDSREFLFDEKDFTIKLFKGLSDLIIIMCCLIPVIFAITINRNKILTKK